MAGLTIREYFKGRSKRARRALGIGGLVTGVKPSEIGGRSGELPQRKLNFPVDDRAEPPISIEEALAAGGALCPRHGGLIGQRGDAGRAHR